MDMTSEIEINLPGYEIQFCGKNAGRDFVSLPFFLAER